MERAQLLILTGLILAHGWSHGVGLREFQVTDPVNQSKMPAVAFYPADAYAVRFFSAMLR
jgi:hypothetical protein